MKKILVLGSTGMLGHVVTNYLKKNKNYNVVNTYFRSKWIAPGYLLDITNKSRLEEIIRLEQPEIVINCIGILVKESLTNQANTIYINSFLPHQLSELLNKSGGRLIHISTDCVFSGIKGSYSELDFRDADDLYGKSKALGEIINAKDLTLRTSIIGPELKTFGQGLFHWFMSQKEEVRGFLEVYWAGVTTLELAKVIEFSINNNITGLVHVSNGEKISKFGLLMLLNEIWKNNSIRIMPCNLKKEDKSLLPSAHLKYIIPSYRRMFEELFIWMESNEELYRQLYK